MAEKEKKPRSKVAKAFAEIKTPPRKGGNAPAVVPSKVSCYGLEFDRMMPRWAVELYCYGRYPILKDKGSLLQRHEHFIRAAEMFWPAKKSSTSQFVWHPWAEEMLIACCYNNRVAFAGSSSSGKSRYLAVWLLVNYMSRPPETLCLATSTTIRDSKKRIWGAIQTYYAPVRAIMPYSKIIDSPTPCIYHINANGQRVDTAGVYLIPAEAKKSDEVTGKMRGMKADGPSGRVFLAADELTDLSPAVVTTALSNLSNNPTFHFCGAANPNTYYDAFSLIAKPAAGWESISVEDTEWKTEIGGVCLHFDALKNPNFLARENLWPIQAWEKVQDAVENFGNKPEFWRDYRAFWCPEGLENFVYSGPEIVNSKADQKAVWLGERKRVAGFDPSFVTGGDRGMLSLGWVGISKDGVQTVEFDKEVHLAENPGNKTDARAVQIANQIKEKLREFNVPVYNLGVDSTGGGAPFCDILTTVLGSNDFMRVGFGGKPSSNPVSAYDSTPSDQKYVNRVTEIWFYGTELMRAGQLRGITRELAVEMTSRKYDTKRDQGTRLVVEPKTLMKARLGNSPDLADSFFIMLQVARERMGMQSVEGQPKGAKFGGGYS